MVSIPSTGDRVSRRTPAIVAGTFINLVVAQLRLMSGIGRKVEGRTTAARAAAR